MTNMRLSYNGSRHKARENGSCILHIDDGLSVCSVEKDFGIEYLRMESLEPNVEFRI